MVDRRIRPIDDFAASQIPLQIGRRSGLFTLSTLILVRWIPNSGETCSMESVFYGYLILVRRCLRAFPSYCCVNSSRIG
jgi:hypothetical protein